MGKEIEEIDINGLDSLFGNDNNEVSSILPDNRDIYSNAFEYESSGYSIPGNEEDMDSSLLDTDDIDSILDELTSNQEKQEAGQKEKQEAWEAGGIKDNGAKEEAQAKPVPIHPIAPRNKTNRDNEAELNQPARQIGNNKIKEGSSLPGTVLSNSSQIDKDNSNADNKQVLKDGQAHKPVPNNQIISQEAEEVTEQAVIQEEIKAEKREKENHISTELAGNKKEVSTTDKTENANIEQLDLSSLMVNNDDTPDQPDQGTTNTEVFTLEKLKSLKSQSNSKPSINEAFNYSEEEVKDKGNIGEVVSEVKRGVKAVKDRTGVIKDRSTVKPGNIKYIISAAVSILSAMVLISCIGFVLNKTSGIGEAGNVNIASLTDEDKENIKLFNKINKKISKGNFYAKVLVDNDGSYASYFHNKYGNGVMQYGESMNIVYGNDGTVVRQDISTGECNRYGEPQITWFISNISRLLSEGKAEIEVNSTDDLLRDKYTVTVREDGVQELLKGMDKGYREGLLESTGANPDSNTIVFILSIVWQGSPDGMEVKLEAGEPESIQTIWFTDNVIKFGGWDIDEGFYKKADKGSVDKTISNLEEAVIKYNSQAE